MRRNDIQFLRFIAITSVTFSFIWPEIFPNANLGGSLFFVISGYLVSGAFEETAISATDIFNFYFKRVRRVLPIYYVTLIFVLIFLYISIWGKDILSITDIYNASLFKTFLTEYNMEKALNSFYHCWALTVHLIFTLIFPMVVHFFYKYPFLMKNRNYILVTIIFSNLIFLSIINFDSFFGRFWQFCVGILAFQNSIPKKYYHLFFASIFSLCLIPFIPVFQLSSILLFPLDTVIISVICGIILAFKNEYFYSENPNFIVKNIFHIGDISFIIYLLSWPLTNYCKYIFMVSTLSIPMGIGIIWSSVITSIFLHYLAEDPLFKYCNTPKRLIIVSVILFSILIALLCSFTSAFFVALKFQKRYNS